MDEARLSEYQWATEDERAMILSRFCDRSALLEMGETLDIDWFDEKNRIGYNEEDEAAAKIAAQVTDVDQLKELLSRFEIEKPSFTPWFWGRHYSVAFENGSIMVEEEPAEDQRDELREQVKELAADDDYIGPLLRGILMSGRERHDSLSTDFSDATAEGSRFYTEGGAFHPSNKAGLPGQLACVSTRSGSSSGRTYRVAKEVAPVIWQALDELDAAREAAENEPVEAPEQEVPTEFARRIPKFEEIFADVELDEDDVQEFESILEKNDGLEYWKDYVAPRVKFRDTAKRAVLCMLASPEDQHGNKGRTNAIIYGPPGTGKTAFKNFLTDKFGAYSIDGARVSKADLTYNKNTGEDGLLVHAHKGLAVIEEADEMSDDALGAALTAFGESGMVEIRDMQLPAEVRGVMLGNYRSEEAIIRQHGEALFNRFEFVIEFEQLNEDQLDETLDWHYQFFRKPKPKEDASLLKKYLKWVREFDPDVPDDSLRKIQQFKRDHIDEIENVREGISIMNVAYTIARLNHRDVSLDDYKAAYKLIS